MPGGRLANMAEDAPGAAVARYITQAFAVAMAEVEKLRHDPLELFTRAIQPVLWLLLFGEVMARAGA